MAISWIFWINGQSTQIWRTVNLKYLELQKCDLPFWRHLTPYYLIKKGQLPSSIFKVSNFLMKDLHFSILDVHKTILTPWASLKISTMLCASKTFFFAFNQCKKVVFTCRARILNHIFIYMLRINKFYYLQNSLPHPVHGQKFPLVS